MKRNWYVICTQQKQEKKVVALLNRKGIENFCPFTIIETKNVSRSAKAFGPLFNSFVFVCVTEVEIKMISRFPFVVNPLYWKSKPAVIHADEINAIKMMIENYSTVCLEKMPVNTTENIGVKERSITGYNNNVTTIKHQGVTVTLPSLGYSISSSREKERTAPVMEKQLSASTSFIRKFNPLLLFGF